MKRIFLLSIALGGLVSMTDLRDSHAQLAGPPACATGGDKDLDGVPDTIDSDEKDSCLASATGFEDCSTGAGDGLPDCQ